MRRALLPRLERAARRYLAVCEYDVADAIAALLFLADDDDDVRRAVDVRDPDRPWRWGMSMPQDFLDAIASALLARGGRRTKNAGIEFRCFEDAQHQHSDRRPSAWWSYAKRCWSCRACSAKGGAFDAAKRLGIPLPARRDAAEVVYPLRDAGGALVAEQVRVDQPGQGKRMFWRRHGTPGLKGLKTRDLPLYGADVLAHAPPEACVVVAEGAKSAEALTKRYLLGVVPVATVTGAATIPVDAVLPCRRAKGL